jgi:hypothetical protein
MGSARRFGTSHVYVTETVCNKGRADMPLTSIGDLCGNDSGVYVKPGLWCKLV